MNKLLSLLETRKSFSKISCNIMSKSLKCTQIARVISITDLQIFPLVSMCRFQRFKKTRPDFDLKRQFSPWMLLFTKFVMLHSDWSINQNKNTHGVTIVYQPVWKLKYCILDDDLKTFMHCFSFHFRQISFRNKVFTTKIKNRFCLHL